MASDIAVTARYHQVCIQNTGMSSRRSRIVPPPIAVTSPTVYAPNQSNFFEAASRMPLMANAMVPSTSMMNRNVASTMSVCKFSANLLKRGGMSGSVG